MFSNIVLNCISGFPPCRFFSYKKFEAGQQPDNWPSGFIGSDWTKSGSWISAQEEKRKWLNQANKEEFRLAHIYMVYKQYAHWHVLFLEIMFTQSSRTAHYFKDMLQRCQNDRESGRNGERTDLFTSLISMASQARTPYWHGEFVHARCLPWSFPCVFHGWSKFLLVVLNQVGEYCA